MARFPSRLAISSLTLLGLCSQAGAYTLYQADGLQVDSRVLLSYGLFHSDESYNQGGPVKNGAIGWSEGFARYGLYATQRLDALGNSTLYGEFNLVSSGTFGSGDAAGYTDGSERRTAVDRKYLGWRSGDLFPALGTDGLEFSAGSQKIRVGDGFIINGDGLSVGHNLGDGGLDRGGAYYLTARNAFDQTAWLHLGGKGPWTGDLIWIKSDNQIKAKPELGVAVLEHHAAEGTLGLTYVRGLGVDKDYANPFSAQRDGLKVVSLRGQGNLGVESLFTSFEYAHQEKQQGDESAWYMEAGWTFAQAPWQPQLAYRYSRYSEDYDPLFSGYSRGYGTWFQGEVAANYSGPFQRNATVQMLRLEAKPHRNVAVGALLFDFNTLDNRQGDLSARELDLYVDVNFDNGLTISPLIGLYKPDKSAEQGGSQLGSRDLNLYSQLVVTYGF
ncbi:hypothetical protein GUY40_15155 [Pseudomonas sp. R5(2019)]|nr:hypothetical protein [Pseudomonas sp. R5(2019)]